MAETLTDVDQFDASIQMPSNDELADAADLRDKAVQRLANRTRNNKNRIDDLETDTDAALVTKVTAGVARYLIDADTYGSGVGLALTLDQADAGYSLDGTSKLVTVPAKGWYLVTLSMRCTNSSSSSDVSAGVDIRVGGTTKGRVIDMRPGTNTAIPLTLCMSAPVWVETPGTDTIAAVAQPGVGSMITVGSIQNMFGIVRIGAPA